VLPPNRFAIEANAPDIFGASEQSAQQLGGGAFDGSGGDQTISVRRLVATAPCDQFGHIVACDRIDRPDGAEVIDDAGEVAFRVVSTTLVLTDLVPIAASGNVERHARAGDRCSGVLDALAFGLLYRLRFASVRPFRRAVKASTSLLEVEVVERRALGLVDGHDCCAFCRVRLAMRSSRSELVNIIFSRCLPRPTLT
jgi:hypothetical protein